MSLENAAAAFDRDMGNTKSMSTADKGSGEPAPAEPIFEVLGNLEVDDDSPARGGGDDAPTAEELRNAPRREKKAPKRDPEDDEDPYAGFTDEEREAMGFPPREPGDDDERDGEDENDEEGDDEDDSDDLMAREFDITVDGEETKVSLGEALQGYIRQKTFDQRMNFANSAYQEVTELAGNVVQMRQDVDAKLAEAEDILKSLIPTEPNWDELFAKNPAEARALQKQYEGLQGKLKEISDKRKANAASAQQDDLTNTVNYRNREAKKFAGIAKWDSVKSREKDLASMTRTALSSGFSPDEVKQVMDSRMLHILLKASKYDRMMAAKPKPTNIRQQQRPANPGAGRTRTAPKGNDRAMKTLQRTGSVEAAASVFEGILKRS
jgi:hypothetical protein